jgi:6-phosphogluconolactonase (cycloisomerase 2 family)
MHVFRRTATAISLLALAAAGLATTAHGAYAQEDVVGHVYVDNNVSGPNTVSAFDRHADGSLTLLPGSPFAAGGTGTGKGLSSQGAIQLSDNGRYLLVADAGSNQISVLRIGQEGALRPVEGTPVWSRGVSPVSIAVHDDLVYAANNAGPTPNIAGFTLNSGGHLRPLNDSPVPVPAGFTPGDVLFNRTGTNLVVTLLGPQFASPSATASYSVNDDGELTAAAGSPFHVKNAGTIGAEFRPTNPAQLFISNAHDGPLAGSISAFNVERDGIVTAIGAPVPDNQTAPCWVEISHDGRYLFTTNTASSSVSSYSIAADGSLTLIGSTTLRNPTGIGAIDLRLDPSGHYLYVTDAGLHAVTAFAVSGGNLTELASSPFATFTGGSLSGIVVD